MDQMPLLIGFTALIGLLIGSFLNVVIGRVPEGRSVVRPASACPRCGNEIRTRDNIPIVSWLLLGRKCRDCSLPISGRYPLVEGLTAALFGLTTAVVGWEPVLPAVLCFVAGGVALSAIDIDTQRLPTKLVYVVLGLVGLCLAGAAVSSDDWVRLAWAAAGAVVSAGFLLVLVIGSKGQGMGLGDVRLALILGAITGWFGPGRSAIGIFTGFAVGSVIGIALALRRRKLKGVKMPFGPALIMGAWLAVLWGGDWWASYRTMLGF